MDTAKEGLSESMSCLSTFFTINRIFVTGLSHLWLWPVAIQLPESAGSGSQGRFCIWLWRRRLWLSSPYGRDSTLETDQKALQWRRTMEGWDWFSTFLICWTCSCCCALTHLKTLTFGLILVLHLQVFMTFSGHLCEYFMLPLSLSPKHKKYLWLVS